MEKKRFGRNEILLCVAVTLLVLLLQRVFGMVGNNIADSFSYETLDPDGAYLGNIVHHTTMMLLSLVAILILRKVLKLEFGLGLGDRRVGIRFAAVYTAVLAGISLVVHVLMSMSGSLPVYDYPLSTRNIIGTLCFQLFFTGPAEELLYRALPITILVYVLGRRTNVKWGITLETTIAAFLFAIAHAKWSLFPPTFQADYFQLLYAFAQGIIAGKAYQDSRSIIYPMFMHSISNVLMVQTGYLFILLSS
jgi:membrane protease YdiL (CAAX protease family)